MPCILTVFTCTLLTDPDDGTVSCSSTNMGGSVCTYTCDSNDFALVGESVLTCEDDGDLDNEGEWNNDPPVCTSKCG